MDSDDGAELMTGNDPGEGARPSERAAGSVAMLRRRVDAVPAHLRSVLARRAALPELPAKGGFAITGVGASEAPARYLGALLRHRHGRHAPVVPLSCFVADDGQLAGDNLVLFSQGLSPNARLALGTAARHRSSLLVTTLRSGAAGSGGASPTGATAEALARVDAAERAGTVVVCHPPAEESGTLLRVAGPAVAAYVAALLVAPPAERDDPDLARVPDVVAGARPRVVEACRGLDPIQLCGNVVFVTGGCFGEAYHGPRWKWLEGLNVAEPPRWDVMQVAHGAFQQLYEQPAVVVTFEHTGAPAETRLFDRLADMLVPARHALVRLPTELPRHLALLEHDALATELLLLALEHCPRDLCSWPAMGLDAPLYGIDEPLT